MTINRLGKSDIFVSALGTGCWSYGGGSYWGAQSQRDVDEVVAKALDFGMNYFDTAEGYNAGESEKSLGLALKSRRGDAVIGTKIAMDYGDTDQVSVHCEASLRRLNTDYIDLYMIHWPRTLGIRPGEAPNPKAVKMFDALEKLKKEGKIRAIGVSNFGPRQLDEVFAIGTQIAANQLSYSLFTRAIEAEILPVCRQRGISILGYSSLMQGVLSGKYAALDQIPPNLTRTRHFSGARGNARHGERGAEEEMIKALDGLRALADELKVSMSALAISFCVAQPGVDCTLAGSRNIGQLAENYASGNYALSVEAFNRLSEITKPLWIALGDNPDYYMADSESRIR